MSTAAFERNYDRLAARGYWLEPNGAHTAGETDELIDSLP